MKKTFFALAFILSSLNAFACVEFGHKIKICAGDTVFPDTYTHPKGAKVLAINATTSIVTVQSNNTGGVERFAVRDISLANVCLNHSCSGRTVFPDSFYHTDGAWVLAANPFTRRLTVVAHTTGRVYRLLPREFSVGRGCIQGICVKDVVYPDDYTNAEGAFVIAVNPYTRTITVVSRLTGTIGYYKANLLSVLDYCADYTAGMRGHQVYTEDVVQE